MICEGTGYSVDGHRSHSVEGQEHPCDAVGGNVSARWNLAVLVER